MPQYCLVKHRISTYVIDGDDVDRNPDRVPVTGVVTFIPLLNKGDSVVVTEDGGATTITLAPIEALITNGEIYHRGGEGVKLFAGGPDANPERIRYRAKFSNLIAGGKRIDLKEILFEAVPGGELTLSMLQPVPGKPYPGYSATIEAGIAQIADTAVSYLDQVEGARDEALGQVEGARYEALGQVEGAVEAAVGEVFAPASTNLFDPSTATIGVVLTSGSVTETPNDNYAVSAPIPVEGGAEYSSAGVLRVTFLDRSGNYAGQTASGSFTTPATASHMRLNINILTSSLNEVQLNAGPELLPYEPYYPSYVPAERLDLSGVQPRGDYLEGPISPWDATFFDHPTNLFDPSQVTLGVVISAGGSEPSTNAGFQVTHPVPMGELTTYTVQSILRVTCFSADGEYVGHQDGSSTSPRTHTTPAGTAYVRLSVDNRYQEVAQLNLGSELLPYTDGVPRIKDVHLPDRTMGEGPTPFMVDAPGLGEIYTAPVLDAFPALDSIPLTTVYQWFDDLVAAHPEYVTKRDLGVVSDEATHMYAYTLRPPEVATDTYGATSPAQAANLPVVMLVGGIHGYEQAGPYYLWRFAKALCDEWDTSPVLDAIRWNVEVVIVPVGNPWGWELGRDRRKNANGVDLARNFPSGWLLRETESNTYGGPAPLSEPEAQYLDALMQEVAPRCVLGGSFHNFSTQTGDRPPNLIWQAAASDYTMQLGKKLISRMSRKWNREQEWITNPQTYYGYADLGAPGGSEGRAFESHGIPGSTFETSRRHLLGGADDEVNHSSQAMTMGYEATVNYIAIGLAEGLRLKQ